MQIIRCHLKSFLSGNWISWYSFFDSAIQLRMRVTNRHRCVTGPPMCLLQPQHHDASYGTFTSWLGFVLPRNGPRSRPSSPVLGKAIPLALCCAAQPSPVQGPANLQVNFDARLRRILQSHTSWLNRQYWAGWRFSNHRYSF